MITYAILATDPTGLIGLGGSIPWRSRADMRFFKTRTMGGVCVMGRKTFESIPVRPGQTQRLPGRCEVVVSRTLAPRLLSEPARCSSLGDAVQRAKGRGEPIFIAGGGQIYAEAFARGLVDVALVTTVPAVEVPDGAEVTRFDLGLLDGWEDMGEPLPDGFADEGLGFKALRRVR